MNARVQLLHLNNNLFLKKQEFYKIQNYDKNIKQKKYIIDLNMIDLLH